MTFFVLEYVRFRRSSILVYHLALINSIIVADAEMLSRVVDDQRSLSRFFGTSSASSAQASHNLLCKAAVGIVTLLTT
jgi:hypothetical protein